MINLKQHGYTHNQVLNLMAAPRGVRDVSYRLDVLRQGVKVCALDYEKCTYDCNASNNVKYSATIYAKDNPKINWRTDFIRPTMTLHANGLDFEYAFTPLKCLTPRNEIRNGIAKKHIEAYDETVMLENNSLGYELIIPKDTLYTAAVELILNKAGFKNVNIIASDKKVAEDRDDWNIDTPLIDVINDLLDEINYRSLEVGRDGILTAFENKEPSAAGAKIHYKADNKSVILNDKDIENDDFRRFNRFVGHVFTPNMTAPMRYEYLNDNPASPTSPTNNGGYTITAVKEFQDVADYNTLVDNVHRWANEVQQSYEQVVMHSALMPHHEVKEILSCSSQGVNGIYVENAWSFDNFGAGGKMTHELRRAVYE